MTALDRLGFLALTLAIYAGQHMSSLVGTAAGDWSADELLSSREGGWERRAAYLLMGLIGVVWWWAAAKRPQRLNGLLAWTLGATLAWAALSVTWSDEPGAAVRRLVVILLLMVAAIGSARRWPVETLAKFAALSGAALIAVGVVIEVSLGGLGAGGEYRFQGTLHPNEQGALCAVVALSALACAIGESTRRALFVLIFLFAGLGLALTMSRGACAGFLVGAMVLVLPTLSPPMRFTLAYGSAVAGLAAILLLGPGIVDRAQAGVSLGRDGLTTLTGRIPLWNELVEYYVRERPLHGYGFETFWTDERVVEVSHSQKWGVAAAHSAPLELVLTMGLIGFALHTLLLLVAAGVSIQKFVRTRRPAMLLGASFCAMYLGVGMIESVLAFKASAISFYFCSMVVAVGMDYERRSSARLVAEARP